MKDFTTKTPSEQSRPDGDPNVPGVNEARTAVSNSAPSTLARAGEFVELHDQVKVRPSAIGLELED